MSKTTLKYAPVVIKCKILSCKNAHSMGRNMLLRRISAVTGDVLKSH